MKKFISILLVVVLLIISPATVFAVDIETKTDTPSYDLEELFAYYHAYSLGEMVEFVGSDQVLNYIVDSFRGQPSSNSTFCYQITLHMAGEYKGKLETFASNLDAAGFSNNRANYIRWSARIVSSSSFNMFDKILLGEMGNKCFTLEINEEFIEYVNSLDRIEGNMLIINFLMNILRSEEVVGISFSEDQIIYKGTSNSILGDCNGDGNINGVDGYLLRGILSGNDYDGIDPLAVDMNSDGCLNAKDSLDLKKKVVIG